MSKLDEVVQSIFYDGHSHCTEEYCDTFPDDSSKEQIKALFLELVGSDQPTGNLSGNFPGAAERNQLRQELRDKINQL